MSKEVDFQRWLAKQGPKHFAAASVSIEHRVPTQVVRDGVIKLTLVCDRDANRITLQVQIEPGDLEDLITFGLLGRNLTRHREGGVDVILADLLDAPVDLRVMPGEDIDALMIVIAAVVQQVDDDLFSCRRRAATGWAEADIA